MAVSSTHTQDPSLAVASETKNQAKDRSEVIRDLIQIIELEYKKGNASVTEEKYKAFLHLSHLEQQNQNAFVGLPKEETAVLPVPPPQHPLIFYKFKLPRQEPVAPRLSRRKRPGWSLKRVESLIIAILEGLANVLDNLHLLAKLPMFPQKLAFLLKHTNRVWVLVLVFLIRKTLSQFLNVRRKERKVLSELSILKSNANSKLLEADSSDNSILRKYEKLLKDLSFDKMMLKFELFGNLLDLSFNVIELYKVAVPNWFMSVLNFASMGMTLYRMNKDDEYLDDDISADII